MLVLHPVCYSCQDCTRKLIHLLGLSVYRMTIHGAHRQDFDNYVDQPLRIGCSKLLQAGLEVLFIACPVP
jgi:hypothetical protein